MMFAAIFVAAIMVSAGVFVLFTLPGGSGGDSLDNLERVVVPKVLPTGTYTNVTTGTVSEVGGMIQVTGSGPLSGLKIDVPPTVAQEPVQFRVSYATVDLGGVDGLPEGASVASRMIQIETTGSPSWNAFKMFDGLVRVTLPYDPAMVQEDEQGIRFYQYDQENASLEPTGFDGQDLSANTLSFQAATFSKFVAVEMALTFFENMNSSLTVDTGFRPKNDGWFIPNYGSYLSSGGNCLGMTSLAKWYFSKEKAGSGACLYQKYREGNTAEWRDDATAIQLATRSQVGLQGIWASLTQAEKQNHTSKQVGLSILHGMLVSGEPQLIGLKTRYTDGTWADGGHAILAYRYSGGRFDVYDPNNPGTAAGTDQQQIPYNYSKGFSRIFNSGLNAANPLQFNVFYHASAKVYSPNNAFKGIFDMAEQKFQGSSIFPDVKLTDEDTNPVGTTPVDIDSDGIRDTSSNKVIISGTITGGQGNVTSTLVFVSGQKFEAVLDPTTKAFSVEVPVKQGENDVVILATDSNTFTNWAGYKQDKIKSSASQAALTVTLSWDQGSSDVDLHIQEPTRNSTSGRHIYFANKGATGNYPYLDFDNTVGYGPEHYYATSESVLPDPSVSGATTPLYGTYQIKVHYYADHDSDWESFQPITWHLTISYLAFRNEATGQEFWGEKHYSGYLGTANSAGYSNFGTTGAAWSSVINFQYVEPVPSNYGIPNPPQNTFS